MCLWGNSFVPVGGSHFPSLSFCSDFFFLWYSRVVREIPEVVPVEKGDIVGHDCVLHEFVAIGGSFPPFEVPLRGNYARFSLALAKTTWKIWGKRSGGK